MRETYEIGLQRGGREREGAREREKRDREATRERERVATRKEQCETDERER